MLSSSPSHVTPHQLRHTYPTTVAAVDGLDPAGGTFGLDHHPNHPALARRMQASLIRGIPPNRATRSGGLSLLCLTAGKTLGLVNAGMPRR